MLLLRPARPSPFSHAKPGFEVGNSAIEPYGAVWLWTAGKMALIMLYSGVCTVMKRTTGMTALQIAAECLLTAPHTSEYMFDRPVHLFRVQDLL